jgi:hypothetical protein
MLLSRRIFVSGISTAALGFGGPFRRIIAMSQVGGELRKDHLELVANSTFPVFDGQTGYGQISGVRNFTDVTLAKRGDTWWMYGAGLVFGPPAAINLVSASLPAGAPLSVTGWTITTLPGKAEQAAELMPASPAGRWDVGRHCPCYVRGWDASASSGKGAWRERLYYAGSATMFGGPYTIGFAEWDGSRWMPQQTACLKATEPWEHGNVAEPNVIFHNGEWHLWYCAGPDAAMRYAQGYAVSDDGKTWWQRTVFYPAEREVFDYSVIAANGRLEAVFSRGNPNTGHTRPEDGLWWTYAAAKAAPETRESWSEPQQILSVTPGAPAWYANAVWKPSFRYDENDPARILLFFDGAAAGTGGRPVFSVGAAELRLVRT